MDDENKLAEVGAETTYHPPPDHASDAASGDGPADTIAKAAESTRRGTLAPAPDLDESKVETVDLPPDAAPPAGDPGTLPTVGLPAAAPVAGRSAATLQTRRIGDYEVLGELGRGGMGVVYEARHRQLGRVVALKMIRTGAHADAEELGRFLAEAQSVARLQHPGIVQIFDIGQEEGLPYFSLELVDGGSLSARIAKEPLEPREAAQLVEQLAKAMQYAHDRGVLHRDLKPANVLLTAAGQPKITDFGLAKQLESMDSGATQTGTVLGTPSYMSPEQARGDVRELTAATDQYALGAILYHLLTGRPPFLAAKAVETVLQVVQDEPVPPRQLVPKLPADLETICLKALSKDPQRRYASCAELGADLKRFLDGEPIVARPVSRVERAWRWCRRNPRVAVPTAASILLFLIAFGISVGAAWRLSALNTDLEEQTKFAQTQAGIAQANATKAKAAEGEARKQERRANDFAGAVLNTNKLVFLELRSGDGNASVPPTIKRKLVELAARNLESLRDSVGTSGITGAATTLKYHELMSQLYRDEGQTDKAWQQISLAHDIARRRIKDQDNSTASRLNLSAICGEMAALQKDHQRDMLSALAYAQESVKLLESVLADPKPPLSDSLRLEILYHQLAPAYTELGVMYVRLGDPRQALANYEKGQQVRDDLRRDPAYLKLSAKTREANESALRDASAQSLWAMGDIYYRLAEPERGAECFDKTLAIYGEIAKQSPTSPFARQKLLGASSQAGYWRFVTGKPDEARPLYEQSLDLAAKLAAEYPTQVPLKATLALIHYRMGVLLHAQHDPRAKEQFDTCLRIRAQLAASNPANDKRKLELLLALARSGRPASAARVAREILSQVQQPDIELLLDLARAYAQCSVADASAAGAEAHRINALYAIRQAVALGHQDKVYLATEPDFLPLRGIPEFQALAATGTQP